MMKKGKTKQKVTSVCFLRQNKKKDEQNQFEQNWSTQRSFYDDEEENTTTTNNNNVRIRSEEEKEVEENTKRLCFELFQLLLVLF